MDPLTLDTQRFPAGYQNMDLRSITEDVFGQYSQGLDEVLTAVENKQHSLVFEEGEKTGNGIIGMNRKSECQRKCARNEASIVERAEVEEIYRALKGCEQGVADLYSDGRFANSAGSDDADKAPGRQLFRYFLDIFLTSDHPR